MAEKRILVVYRDSLLADFLKRHLRGKSYQIIATREDGRKLKELVERELPHLVILDIMMPRMDGIEVCLRLRQWSPVSILMLSTWGAGTDMVRGLDFASDTYLTKPFGREELEAQLKVVFDRNGSAGKLTSPLASEISTSA
ncbi:MAG: response regulator transcription factor [Chloroflexota bacterium]